MPFSRTFVAGAALAAALSLACAHAAQAPSCTSIGRAVSAAIGPVTSVTDNTARIHALKATTPYAVLRACDVHVPGHKLPLQVTIDAPVPRLYLQSMAKFAASTGRHAQKLDGAGYGDLAYLIPQMGGGNAVDALVGDEALSIGYWATAAETRNMAQHIVALMK
ncbi:hypothetical protein [Thiomonas sp. FB-6]|uniref:hypothetical protein n=1 Tax=Thiomonas sp. FB-6 TaxID=1158291 RepID=UPI0003A37775|nr:hypothetical protein [Thiomonas sp. FB-6]